MISDIRKLATLVKTVLGGEKGKELLDELGAANKVAFTPDTNEQYRRVGRNELIQELEYLRNASADDIKHMEEADSYIDSNDF